MGKYKDPIAVFKSRLKIVENKDFEKPCLIYTGSVSIQGYGKMMIDGVEHRVHRLAWILATGNEIKNQINHLCHVKLCCEPTHLYDGTQQQNMNDLSKIIQSTPEFPCGHARTETNSRIIFYNNRKRFTKACKCCAYVREKSHRE